MSRHLFAVLLLYIVPAGVALPLLPFASAFAPASVSSGNRDCTWRRTTTQSPTSVSAHISFEYCTGCRWDLRSFWLAHELLQHSATTTVNLTFVPSQISGRMRITSAASTLLYEKSKGVPFPEPTTDVLDRWLAAEASTNGRTAPLPHVAFLYNTRRDQQRCFYLAQELLRTFANEIRAVSLLHCPVDDDDEHLFRVQIDTTTDAVSTVPLWDSATSTTTRYPETKVLKQLVRDAIAPTKDLGHSDCAPVATAVDEMDDDEAEEARKFFGVM